MPNYKYSAKDLNNKTRKGVIEAADPSKLYSLLREQSLTLMEYAEVEEKKAAFKFKATQISEFARQMGEMLGSGLTVAYAIETLKESEENPKIYIVYDTIYKSIFSGLTLSEALKECNGAFPGLFINMCTAGESSGQLEPIMRKMAEHYEKEARLNGKIKSAMSYPIILLSLLGVAMIAIFAFILPMFFELFEGMELPVITQIVMAISDFILGYWYILLAVAILVPFVIKALLAQPKFRLAFDKMKLSMPIIKKPLKIIYTARFARGLSSLYSSGLPLIECLGIASTLTNNKYIESLFPDVIRDIRNGESLSVSMKQIKEFDIKLIRTLHIGEESGRLVQMLESSANGYDFEADQATGKLVSMLEPMLIIIMALFIGVVLISVMLPIFSLYGNIQNM